MIDKDGPYLTTNLFEVTAYLLLFDIRWDETKTGEQAGKTLTAFVYHDRSKLPNPRKITVGYSQSGADKHVPLLTAPFSTKYDFQTMFNTIRKTAFDAADRVGES